MLRAMDNHYGQPLWSEDNMIEAAAKTETKVETVENEDGTHYDSKPHA
ncbi:MAG: hypothetical protein WBB01_03990 [Phormidesmis sp.]